MPSTMVNEGVMAVTPVIVDVRALERIGRGG